MQIPVRIVLVETTHPGNIGATARAMKTMGLMDLALVGPRVFPSDEATARASGAADLLARASIYGSLSEAIADCGFVVGTSARARSVEWPSVDPRECAERTFDALEAGNGAAIVFGPEQSGLTNEALGLCTAHVQIPTQPDFSSLNLGMAVQVLCYELRMTALARRFPRQKLRAGEPAVARQARPGRADAARPRLATAAELESFHEHLERVLTEAGFLRDEHPRQLKLKLRRIFHRASLDKNDIDILRGVLTALDPAKRAAGRRGA
jgi:tRNA (cytidine32/uridine32-2'-O)-methyltransferase